MTIKRLKTAAYALMVIIAGVSFGCAKGEALKVQTGESLEVCSESDASEGLIDMQDESAQLVPSGKIYVHVCGQVVCPGLYQLDPDSRVWDAIALAGGFLEEADQNRLNLAEKIHDGQQIYVPMHGEDTGFLNQAEDMPDPRIDINHADKDKLMTLPGVGEARASDIIAYRTSHGEFQAIEEIMLVSGIKEHLFERIKDLIKV